MKLKNIINDTLFVKSLKLAKSSLNKISLMILFDSMFFVSFFALKALAGYSDKLLGVPKTLEGIFIKLIFSLVYFIILLLLYSFFKYCILSFIRSLFEKTQFSFNRLGQFYSLNLIIAAVFFAIMLILSFILSGIKQSYAPYTFIIFAIPYLLFLYIIINISHSLFYQGSSLKDAIKNGFNLAFAKIKKYRESILVTILAALILYLLFFGVGYLIRALTFRNYTFYLTVYTYFKQISIIIFDIVAYLLILINRISFYALAKEIK